MIVHAGHVHHETRLGTLNLDRRLDDHQVEIVCRALEHAGLNARDVTCAVITEAGAIFRTLTDELADRPHRDHRRAIVTRAPRRRSAS